MNLHFKPNRKYRGSSVTINIFPEKNKSTTESSTNNVNSTINAKTKTNIFVYVIIFLKKIFWNHPKKIITSLITAIIMWLMSFYPFKLPNLPFLPVAVKSVDNKKQQTPNEESNKRTESQEQIKNSVITNTVTNTITQTNIVTKTNYVTETKYITNFILQPIIVTNTIFKEVPIIVTNVLIIKNNTTDTNSNNKNGAINGPAFFITDDFNTLLQNQQQNPVKGKTVN